jgi:hypothetical protein
MFAWPPTSVGTWNEPRAEYALNPVEIPFISEAQGLTVAAGGSGGGYPLLIADWPRA